MDKLRLRRRAIHLCGGSLMVLGGAYLEHDTLLWTLGIAFLLLLGIDLARMMFPSFNKEMIKNLGNILKQHEHGSLAGSTYFVFGALASYWLFPTPLAILALIYATFGDVAASITGRVYKLYPLVGKKTLSGSAAFFAACILGAGIGSLLWLNLPVQVILTGAIIATIAELLIPLDDNLAIPVLSGLAMMLIL